MKRVVGLFLLGALTPMLQGAIGGALPTGLCPDLSFLFVVGVGLCWRSTAGGLVLAGFTGFVADLLSGSLLGQHALLRVLAYVAARLISVHINLLGARSQIVFVALLTIANALALGALTAFFSRGTGFDLGTGEVLRHALVNAVVAPFVVTLTGLAVARLGDEDGGRRLLRLEPRDFST